MRITNRIIFILIALAVIIPICPYYGCAIADGDGRAKPILRVTVIGQEFGNLFPARAGILTT